MVGLRAPVLRVVHAAALFAMLVGVSSNEAAAQTLNMSHDLVPLGIAAQNLTPNNPSLDARPLFRAAVQYVLTHHVQLLTLDRGSYYFLTPQSPSAYLVISNLADTTIDLAGSTIYFSDPRPHGIQLYYCQRVILTNFTTDYINPPYTHVQLASVDAANRVLHYAQLNGWSDPSIFSGDARMSESSPVVALAFRDGKIVPGTGRMPVRGPIANGDLFLFQNGAPWTQSATLSTLRTGDTIVVTFRGGLSPVLSWYSDSVTLSDITIHGAGGWALQLEQTSNSTVDHLRIEPRPGALIGSSADGIHFSSSLRNNHIRNSYIAGTVDDALIMDSLDVATVLAQSGPREITVQRNIYSRFPDATAINFVDSITGSEFAGGIIASQDPPDSRNPVRNGQVTLTFDRDLPTLAPGTGMVFGDPSMRGAGSTIEDNVVEDIPFGRGIWIGGSRGVVVQRNVVRRTSSGGVVVSQGTVGFPGPPAHDITIQSNSLEENLGPMASGTGTQTSIASVIVQSTGPGFRFSPSAVNTNVSVLNNYIADSGRGGIWMGETSGGRIENNLITRWYQHPELPIWGIPPDLLQQVQEDVGQPIVVRYSSGVDIQNNDILMTSSIAAPVTFSPALASVPASASSGSFEVVTALSGLEWKAGASDNWISLAAPGSGSGTGRVYYSVSGNPASMPRTGAITVAGETFVITQEADSTPPTITALPSPGANPNGWNNTDVTVNFSATDSASGVKAITYSVDGAPVTKPGASASVVLTTEGVHTIGYRATDNAGNVSARFTQTVRIDRTKPVLTCVATPNVLWPANHKMISITTAVSVADTLSGAGGFALTSAASSEPDDSTGDGAFVNDIQGWTPGTPDTAGLLRAERAGSGRGRMYTLMYQGADKAGNTAQCSAGVSVPRDQGK